MASNTKVGVFILNNEAEYPWTCYVFTPNPNGGKKIKQKLKVKFRHIGKKERLDLLDEFKQKQRDAVRIGDNPQSDDDADVLKELVSFQRMMIERVLIGFECVDRDGNPVEPTDEAKDVLLDNTWAEDAIMYGLQQSWIGRNDEGN